MDGIGGEDQVEGTSIEAPAGSARREHSRLAEKHAHFRAKNRVRSSREGEAAFTGEEAAAREMEGDEGRGAGRVHYHAWTVQVEAMGNPVGGNSRRSAGR